MTEGFENWLDVLTAATQAAHAADTTAALDRATSGLRVAWAAIGAVDTALDVASELWWLALAEAVADAIDEVDQIPGTTGLPTMAPGRPDADLADSAEIRTAVHNLLTAVQSALLSLSRESTMDGQHKLAAALAGAAVAAATARPTDPPSRLSPAFGAGDDRG